MELGGSPHALRMSLIDVSAYPPVAINRSVASRSSARECSASCCFFVGHISVRIITDRLASQRVTSADFADFFAVSSRSTKRWHAERMTVHTEATTDELLGLFPPGTCLDSDGTLTVGGGRLAQVGAQFRTAVHLVAHVVM